MAGEDDDSQKTEEPTGKRLSDAREKGQVARSQEVSHWFMILALAIVVGIFSESLMTDFGGLLQPYLQQPHLMPLDNGALKEMLSGTAVDILRVSAIPLAIILLAGLLAGTIQNGIIITTEQIQPKLSNIGFKKGFKKMFSSRALTDFVKGLLKLTIVGVVVTLIIWPDRNMVLDMPSMDVAAVLLMVKYESVKVIIGVLSVMSIIALIDVLYQRYQHHKELRMTKQQIKDEHKQSEGDPMVKGRLRQIRAERARKRMMAAVPEADVVITNPTHFAVALKYDQVTMEAPKLLAKGVDNVAFRIRELAEEYDIPIVENPPVARALHAAVEIDHQIPPEHYKAVAEIIGYVMNMRRGLKGRTRR
ncbi:flagellar biosynthesis protein FlhB [Pelagibius litoralis]|uniref:Flagellar biosynthetic protein FlhB n=1 Tax=Pelagibius litoralis TaxID=374515 RepID=A0A967EXV5_9PROT|nr:flagellar biosynthesis protein FlhB [Pelagibius litoralis]NIA69431.1 flagellar biosynthesis protein FlhB [Pelagibius litoralis]